MKLKNIIALSITTFLLSSYTGCDPESIDPIDIDSDSSSTTEILEEDDLGLLYMREEEKLARDVYLTLFDMYDNQVFSNISKAEQRHMDQIPPLLEKYNLDDPSLSEIGLFTNEFLQQLYDDLITQGSDSEIAALIVSATIEDLDINDLDEFNNEDMDPEIIAVYNSLNCGSRNHLWAFISRLTDLGVTYTPQFISQEKFDSIIVGEHEKCGQ